MTIPDFQSLMHPLLELHADGQEHINRDLVNSLANRFNLTSEQRRELLPSGKARLFDNRVGWAKTYIAGAGLIESPRRAISVITDLGRHVLSQKPAAINLRFLRELTDPPKELHLPPQVTALSQEDTVTPQEAVEVAHQKIRQDIERSLLDKILLSPPEFLERVVVDLIVQMGYGGNLKDAGQAIGRSGDEGIDGIIKEDPLGLDTIYLQAKRYNATGGRPDIQKFAGALQGQRAKKGIFITTSAYSKEARDFVSKIDSKIILIDGPMLAQLMYDYGIGVAVHTVYEIKRVDTDYFDNV